MTLISINYSSEYVYPKKKKKNDIIIYFMMIKTIRLTYFELNF